MAQSQLTTVGLAPSSGCKPDGGQLSLKHVAALLNKYSCAERTVHRLDVILTVHRR